MLMLDNQGVQHPTQKFIVKELAVHVVVGKNECACLLFQPPCGWNELSTKYQRTNEWIINNHHGTAWEIGFIPYDDVQDAIARITKGVTIIFANGLQKRQWLQSYTE